MKFYYFDQLPSTQTFLENQPFEEKVLVSTFSQTKGRGRGLRTWTQVGDGVCFSFTWKKEKVLSLKIALAMKSFLKKFFKKDFFIKWPNDLVNHSGEKLGGILVTEKKEGMIVGVGLNINHPQGIQINSTKEKLVKQFPLLFYSFLEKQDLNSLLAFFNNSCYHFNDFVEINGEQGYFLGINSTGEALLKQSDKIINIGQGSLHVRKRN